MTFISIKDIKFEQLNFLRNQDLISTTIRGVTTVTQEFNGDNTTKQFTLTNTTVKNVRDVSIGGVSSTFGTDYTIDWANAQINFIVAPASGTNNVDIQYDYGTTDRIYPDYPQSNVKISSFPRIAFDIIMGSSEEFELGAGSTRTNYTLSISVYDLDKDNTEDLIASIRQLYMQNKKTFYYVDFLKLTSLGPLIPSPFSTNKVFQRNQDLDLWIISEE